MTTPRRLLLETEFATAATAARALAAELRRSTAYQFVAALVNAPEQVAGLEGRFYVRAALDPTYATPAAVGALYRRIMTGEALDLTTRFLTPQNRRTVAEAALRGWAIHRTGADAGERAWHRVFGDQSVNVWIGATA